MKFKLLNFSETQTIEIHCNSLVELLEICTGSEMATPYTKIASDLLSCLFLVNP